MANASYSAANNNWVVTQNSVANNSDHIIFNGTKCTMRVDVVPVASDATSFVLVLEPGESFAYKYQGTAGNVTLTGVPVHTSVYATDAFEFAEHNEGIPAADAELCFSPF